VAVLHSARIPVYDFDGSGLFSHRAVVGGKPPIRQLRRHLVSSLEHPLYCHVQDVSAVVFVHLAGFSAFFPGFFAFTLLTDILVNQRAIQV
jgi:hypothetical protein